MKKLYSLLLVLCLIFSLSACGGNETETDKDTGSSTTQNQTDVTDKSSTEQSTDTSSSITDNIGSSDSTDVPSSTISEPTTTTKPETSKPSSTTKPDTSKSTTTTKPETSKPSTPIHTHSYSDATCTEPSKCSCGATNGSALGHSYSNANCTNPKKCSRCGATSGSALGHKWQDATCKAPKTCSVCKITEGEKSEHIYEDIKCKMCGTTHDKKLETNKEYTYFNLSDDGSASSVVMKFNNSGIVEYSFSFYSVENTEESNEKVEINGKTYYFVGGGGGVEYYYDVSGVEITVYDCIEMPNAKKTITKKLTIMPDSSLVTNYSNGNDYLVNSVFN